MLDEDEDEPEVVWNCAEKNRPGISPTPKNPGNDGDGEGPHKGDHGHHKNGQAVGPLNAAANGAEVHEVATQDQEEGEPEGNFKEECQFQEPR